MQIEIPAYVAGLVLPIIMVFCMLVKLRHFIWKWKGSLFWIFGTTFSIVSCVATFDHYARLRTKPKISGIWREKYLSGRWMSLYNEMNGCSFFEAKLIAFENFCSNEAKTQPKLSPKGFDEFCLLVKAVNNDQSFRHIERLRIAAKDFVAIME